MFEKIIEFFTRKKQNTRIAEIEKEFSELRERVKALEDAKPKISERTSVPDEPVGIRQILDEYLNGEGGGDK